MRNFGKICKFCKFRSAILNTVWVAIFTKNYTATIRPEIKIFWNFDKNPIKFTPDFVVRVGLLIFPGKTSSVSHDVIFFQKIIENSFMMINMKFHGIRLVRSRDIDVLFWTRNRIFKNRKWTLKHTKKYIFGMKRSCWLQKYILFWNRGKIEKFS